jgi:hypothetical protein
LRIWLGVGIALALGATGVARAAATDKASQIIAEKDKAVSGGRAVRVVLAQTEIATTVDVGRVASSANGGGLIGALIITAMDDKQTKMKRTLASRADMLAAPLRNGLTGFDVDALALATTRSALAKSDWFQMGAVVASKDGSPTERSAFLASAGTPQAATVEYSYSLSPDFSQIRVLADVCGERAPGGKGPPIVFRYRVWSVVQLRQRSYDSKENATRWSIEDAKLARAALTSAFGRFEELIPRALSLTKADVDAFTAKGREKAFGADFYGPLIARDPTNPEALLLWSDGLVQVQPIA